MHDLTATFESSDDENINAYYDKSFSVPLSDIDNLKVNRGTKRAFVTGALGGGSLGLIFDAIAPTAAGSAASFDRSFLILGGMLVGSVNDMKEESTFHLKIWIN